MCVLLSLLWLSTGVASALPVQIRGTVSDSSGASIEGAKVTFSDGGPATTTRTDHNGAFVLTPSLASGTILVEAAGFATVRMVWSPGGTVPINFVLRPSADQEQIVVSATRTDLRLSSAPGSTVSLTSADVASTPALAIDDMLRQVPGFTLFRRSGSRVANPTSQGVSLRGLGASGPSRAAVLEDGLSLVDPFGGWVYWGRVPRAALSSVEIFRGGASELYGNSALGGVVQFLTREPTSPSLAIEMSYGNERTPDLSVWGGTKLGRWDVDASADLFHTAGYISVPASVRGSVDTPAASEHTTSDLTLGRRLGADGRVFVRSSYFAEGRHNGTVLQVNDTSMGVVAAGFDQKLGSYGALTARVFGEIQSYNQSFSSIGAGRNSETLTNLQHVPSQQLGANAQWTKSLGRHTLVGGGEWSEVIGESIEQLFSANRNTVAGGRQRTISFFGEDIFRLANWTIVAGLRFDHWDNFRGRSLSTPFAGTGTQATSFTDRSQNALSPRLSLVRALGQHFSITASGYRAFRAPTLNELYRSFRLGNVLTQNNPDLIAEQLTGGEAGVNVTALDRKLQLRSTFFWSDIVDPVSNVTLTSTPTLITRQRQNLGRTRSRGIEAESTMHLTKAIDLLGGYSFTDAAVVRFPSNVGLQGLRIPQVPRHQFTVEGRYRNRKGWMFTALGRYVGVQFDDDQNLLPLDRYFAMDIQAGRSIRGVEAFVAVENVLDQQYDIARTPTPTIGPPILFRVGMRFNYPRR